MHSGIGTKGEVSSFFSKKHSCTIVVLADPGVMIIGYEMFRMLCEDESTAKPKRPGAIPKKPKKLSKAKKLQLKYLEDFQKYLLDPGELAMQMWVGKWSNDF